MGVLGGNDIERLRESEKELLKETLNSTIGTAGQKTLNDSIDSLAGWLDEQVFPVSEITSDYRNFREDIITTECSRAGTAFDIIGEFVAKEDGNVSFAAWAKSSHSSYSAGIRITDTSTGTSPFLFNGYATGTTYTSLTGVLQVTKGTRYYIWMSGSKSSATSYCNSFYITYGYVRKGLSVVKSIQRGTASCSSTTNPAVVTISTVVPEKCMVNVSGGGSGGGNPVYPAFCYVTSLTSTQLTILAALNLKNYSGSASASWEVVEFY